jgi:hypothetical protein
VTAPPPNPTLYEPDPGDPRTALRGRVQDALLALPGYFQSATVIEGIAATDLFSLNTMLGATIEVQVVATLNRMRDVWDPDDEWQLYWFDRQAQTFPDVLLRRDTGNAADVALGIELKGWYVLSKESQPSFRYQVTPAACTRWDLLAVVPWHLSNVLSGTPHVGRLGLWPARYAAVYRNWWWQDKRQTSADTAITAPEGVQPYQPRSNTSDKPKADGGGNFGRIARTGIMDEWINRTLDEDLAGVCTRDWIKFLLPHHEGSRP